MNYNDLEKSLPISSNINILKNSLTIKSNIIQNRMAIQPMEGCDAELDGAPSDLTKRRYNSFSKSGVGLIWFEATAVQNNGRANKRQLFLTDKNLDDFKRIVENIKNTSIKETGVNPVLIMQATHSGRYSKPTGKPEPIIAYNKPIFENDNPISKDQIITDEEVKLIEENYGKTTVLCEKAGFNGIDVKCCHGYLNNEFLSAFNREGIYGGSFQNRTRFFKNCVDIARSNSKNNSFIVTSRMNIYDGFPYPYGFGVKENNGIIPDLKESLELIKILNFELLNITIGNPYQNPKVNRPINLDGVKQMYNLTKQIKDNFPKLNIVSSGPTFLSEFAGNLAAGAVEKNYCDIVGFGRMSFAYPDFAKDLFNNKVDNKKLCVCCGKCTELMRGANVTGCVVRDKLYTDIYKEMVKNG